MDQSFNTHTEIKRRRKNHDAVSPIVYIDTSPPPSSSDRKKYKELIKKACFGKIE